MCIALVQTPATRIPDYQLRRGWDTNPDGGGFAYVHDGKTVIQKGYMKYDDFYRAYNEAIDKYGENSPFLVHLRIGTSGSKSPSNTHPFPIKGGAMIHNGILFTPTGNRAGPAHDRKSDTRVVAESLHNILVLSDIKKASAAIEDAIGSSNKLCFLYDDGSTHIIGEKQGFWDKGIWHSNSSCTGYYGRG